ncbi:hypothetical protein [Buchananella hordeovulneris]|uniref:DUF3017 domain-containing protein n=1 Tax=Buchananella hordeovulneris TaxID=52770 RepID=A0A1Q5PYV4_9ACTO|nr:hypothetical protein [Buchananella hordeovulneris]MDO5081388.1 hypothetical protein [Buchananella hordeovulneris]OKL52811.1 hypothetical protein BSZ40_01545 [Buchananella hordeovulneris]RRD43604.1 hypothetical protein EII13_06595 [Buchananella hordeovulneris]RRD52860.1 hypothetical protein EII12_03800 [Buchananella hordeovulneris]
MTKQLPTPRPASSPRAGAGVGIVVVFIAAVVACGWWVSVLAAVRLLAAGLAVEGAWRAYLASRKQASWTDARGGWADAALLGALAVALWYLSSLARIDIG